MPRCSPWSIMVIVFCSTVVSRVSAAEQAGPLLVHQRAWTAGGGTEQSLLAIGNGRMLAYLGGPDITHVWGPPYTSPNLLQMRVQSPASLSAVSSRERGAGVWHHHIRGDAPDAAGDIIDFVDADLPVLVRRFETRVPLVLTVPVAASVRVRSTGSRYPGRTAVLLTWPVGSPVYGYRFCSQQPICIQLIAEGVAGIVGPAKPGEPLTIKVAPGESTLYAVGGPELPDCITFSELALKTGGPAMLERTRAWWRTELGRIQLPKPPAAWADRLPPIAEDVAVNLIVQQSGDGAVVAGHNYCLAYVRDQFGVARGFLDLGLHHRARQVLEFYWRIYQRAGLIHNAQTIGGWPYFHVHENDDVEMTAYLVQQAMEYLDRTGDTAFVRDIFPMLEWAARAQRRHLVKEMLPFNGDETYIAGGIVPRSCMDHGSAESTYLFFASGRRLADWAERQGLWTRNQADDLRAVCAKVAAAFPDRFIVDGRLMVNNPGRADGLSRDRFRHGVCQAQQAGCGFFGWLELGEDGRYYCEGCYLHRRPEPPPAVRHYLPSVALTPLLVGEPVESPEQAGRELAAALEGFRGADGRLGYGTRRLPGYEMGVLLYAMAEQRHPEAGQVAELLVGLIDPTGAWVEYYEGGRPQGTRYRPWESAMNLSGLIRHLREGQGGR